MQVCCLHVLTELVPASPSALRTQQNSFPWALTTGAQHRGYGGLQRGSSLLQLRGIACGGACPPGRPWEGCPGRPAACGPSAAAAAAAKASRRQQT